MPSDHRVAYLTSDIPKVRKFKWLSYSYRFFNDDSVDAFRKWVVMENWSEVIQTATASQEKALAYQRLLNRAIEACFPLVTMRRKSTDPPWLNKRLRRLMRRRKAVYRMEGRSKQWRRLRYSICLLYTSPSPRDS